MRHTRAARVAVIGAVTALLIAAAGVVTWRVLRPSEVVTPATAPYPLPNLPVPGWQGSLRSAPLLLDLRLRVYASKHRVWSDAAPTENYETSAYWSYRRWPAQLIGVVANPDVVVSSWSDGLLVGTDAQTGKVRWRAESEVLGTEYTGRRTGASTVYQPRGLFSTGSQIIVSGPKSIRGYAISTGEHLWNQAAPACRGTELTTSTQFIYLDSCSGTIHAVDAAGGIDAVPHTLPTGVTTVEPLGCSVGHSSCIGMRTNGSRGWLLPQLTESAPLGKAAAQLVEGIAITAPTPSELVGHDARTGELKWRWQSDIGPANVIASNAERVFLLTPSHTLIAIHGGTGEELSRDSIVPEQELDRPYAVQFTYTHDRYIVLIRTTPGAPPERPDDDYYLTARPVLLAGS